MDVGCRMLDVGSRMLDLTKEQIYPIQILPLRGVNVQMQSAIRNPKSEITHSKSDITHPTSPHHFPFSAE